jgi:hypothetical protein
MPYIYAKIYPKVLLGYEEDKITYRTFDSLDEYILFVNFELPGLMHERIENNQQVEWCRVFLFGQA